MKNNIFKKILLVIIMAFTVPLAHSAAPDEIVVSIGAEGVGGGDGAEIEFHEIRKDLEKWILNNHHLELNFPQGITAEDYKRSMLNVLKEGKIAVSFTNDATKVLVNGREKTCRSAFSSGIRNILCHDSKFMSTGAQKYALVHHEYAVLAGLESGSGNSSEYFLSQQISKDVRVDSVYRLAVGANLGAANNLSSDKTIETFFAAIEAENYPVMDNLIKQGFNLNINKGTNIYTPLMFAISVRKFSVAKYLINSGAEIVNKELKLRPEFGGADEELCKSEVMREDCFIPNTLAQALIMGTTENFYNFLKSRSAVFPVKKVNELFSTYIYSTGLVSLYYKSNQPLSDIVFGSHEVMLPFRAQRIEKKTNGKYTPYSMAIISDFINADVELSVSVLNSFGRYHSFTSSTFERDYNTLLSVSGLPRNWSTVKGLYRHFLDLRTFHLVYGPNPAEQVFLNRKIKFISFVSRYLNIRIGDNVVSREGYREHNMLIYELSNGFECTSFEYVKLLIEAGANPSTKRALYALLPNVSDSYEVAKKRQEVFNYFLSKGYVAFDMIGPPIYRFRADGDSYVADFDREKAIHTSLLYDLGKEIPIERIYSYGPYLAYFKQALNAMKSLLAMGADINRLFPTNSRVALNALVTKNTGFDENFELFSQVISLLESYGVNKKIKNVDGKNAYEILKSHKLSTSRSYRKKMKEFRKKAKPLLK